MIQNPAGNEPGSLSAVPGQEDLCTLQLDRQQPAVASWKTFSTTFFHPPLHGLSPRRERAGVRTAVHSNVDAPAQDPGGGPLEPSDDGLRQRTGCSPGATGWTPSTSPRVTSGCSRHSRCSQT